MSPNCGKCGKANITWTTKSFGGITGKLIYCASCGAAISGLQILKASFGALQPALREGRGSPGTTWARAIGGKQNQIASIGLATSIET